MLERLIIVSENSVLPGFKLIGEHGFCAYLELTDGKKLLFDTGQGMALPHNAEQLEIDLNGIDAVVISHGHYDHTNGLLKLLDRLTEGRIYLAREADANKFARLMSGELKYIGMPRELKASLCDRRRWEFVSEPVQIFDGIWATGPIPRRNEFETAEPMLLVERDGELVQDEVPDDMALVCNTSRGWVVLLGCAHAGVVNTLEYAAEIAGTDRFHAVIGGTHLMFASDERIERTIEALKRFKIELFAPAHCTGFRAHGALFCEFRNIMVPSSAGMEFKF